MSTKIEVNIANCFYMTFQPLYELISADEKSVANKHYNDIVTKFAVGITESQERRPTFYWLPKLHKRPYKAHFIANSSLLLSKIIG